MLCVQEFASQMSDVRGDIGELGDCDCAVVSFKNCVNVKVNVGSISDSSQTLSFET